MDLSKLSKADKIIGIGAIVGLIGTFLPWMSTSWDVMGITGGVSVSGFSGLGTLAFIAALASLIVIALPFFGTKLPKLPLTEGVLQMILGAVVAGIPIIRILQIGRFSFTGVSFGVFVTIAGGIVMIFGGSLKQKEGGVKTPPASTPPTE
ncbi:MAG: hypothetical protein GTN59_01970 [Candidatus Dadabacteria bacterium]|nr:hypothetical protein [Candidatus Dadabacteria bacterium]